MVTLYSPVMRCAFCRGQLLVVIFVISKFFFFLSPPADILLFAVPPFYEKNKVRV